MTTLTKPESKIIIQGEDMYTIKFVIGRHMVVDKDNVIDRVKLGYMVKWCGANHVVQHDNKLLIVEKIEEIQYESSK